MSQYITIAHDSQYEQEIERSRFLTYLFRITTEADAKNKLLQVTKTHPKANHHVWAYVLGDSDQIQRASDNGEPAGTAGAPTLSALLQQDVHDTLAVTVRYFGGVKLGAGGLIRAYAGSANQAIAAVGRVQRIDQQRITFAIAYHDLDPIKNWLDMRDITILNITYTSTVTLEIAVSKAAWPKLQAALTDQLQGQFVPSIGAPSFVEVPLSH